MPPRQKPKCRCTSHGIEDGEAQALAAGVLAEGALDGHAALVVDVVSRRRAYGKLLACYPRNIDFSAENSHPRQSNRGFAQ